MFWNFGTDLSLIFALYKKKPNVLWFDKLQDDKLDTFAVAITIVNVKSTSYNCRHLEMDENWLTKYGLNYTEENIMISENKLRN
jgi:hypothetical protein